MAITTHKGFDIELSGDEFRTFVDKVFFRAPSVAALKKKIDKHLLDKSKEVEFSLPVIVLYRKHEWNEHDEYKVERQAITGMDDRGGVAGIDDKGDWQRKGVYPDVPGTVELVEEWIVATTRLALAVEALDGREFSTHNFDSGRKVMARFERQAIIIERYNAAKEVALGKKA